MVQKIAIYCRVSTTDQSCSRQERDLKAYAKKAGYEVVGVWKETASGSKNNRVERKQVITVATQTPCNTQSPISPNFSYDCRTKNHIC